MMSLLIEVSPQLFKTIAYNLYRLQVKLKIEINLKFKSKCIKTTLEKSKGV